MLDTMLVLLTPYTTHQAIPHRDADNIGHSAKMTQSTVYVETTVIGHLVGRILADPVVAGRQTLTRQWWPTAWV